MDKLLFAVLAVFFVLFGILAVLITIFLERFGEKPDGTIPRTGKAP